MWSTTLVLVIAIALAFDFTNGFHDTANAVATSISTRAMSPQFAVLSAAALNFVGALVSIKVAATIAKGIVVQDDPVRRIDGRLDGDTDPRARRIRHHIRRGRRDLHVLLRRP